MRSKSCSLHILKTDYSLLRNSSPVSWRFVFSCVGLRVCLRARWGGWVCVSRDSLCRSEGEHVRSPSNEESKVLDARAWVWGWWASVGTHPCSE